MCKGLKQGQARPAGDQCAWPSEGTEARIDAEESPCPAFLSAHFVHRPCGDQMAPGSRPRSSQQEKSQGCVSHWPAGSHMLFLNHSLRPGCLEHCWAGGDVGWTRVGRTRQDEAIMCKQHDAEKGPLTGQGRHPGQAPVLGGEASSETTNSRGAPGPGKLSRGSILDVTGLG